MPAEASATIDNSKMKMSGDWRARMRMHEKKVYKYYDDAGPGRGNCTWGIGTLAHYGPCSADELKMPVTDTQIEAVFASRLANAERIVRRSVTSQALTQAQFDALVSFTYNAGEGGAKTTFELVDAGDFQGAANKISSFIYIHIKRKGKKVKVVAPGLIPRRAEESAPFRSAK
jgi:lysozyme